MQSELVLPKDIRFSQNSVPITTANATDLATAIALANDLKIVLNKVLLSYNELLFEMRVSGIGK